MQIPRTLNQDFFKIWTPGMAYVLGYFAADGSMIRNARGGNFIEFTSVDKILITQLREAVGSNHRIARRERGGNARTAYRIQIGSKEWFTDLSALGFTQNKSNALGFPEVPDEYFGHFVRGYFDGDGCVYFRQHWSRQKFKQIWVFGTLFTSGSKCFLEELHIALRNYGVKGGYLRQKTKRGFDLVLSRHDSLALYRLMYNTAEVADLFLPRKREKFERAIQVLGFDTSMQS